MNQLDPDKPENFWAHYLNEHRSPLNRRLHVCGTTLAIAFIGLALYFREPWFLVGAFLCGYAFAWFGHFFVEKNRPATLTHPVQSLFADFKMFFLIITRRFQHPAEKDDANSRRNR